MLPRAFGAVSVAWSIRAQMMTQRSRKSAPIRRYDRLLPPIAPSHDGDGRLRRAAGADGDHSLLLLKPDAITRNLEPAIRRELAGEGLELVCRHDLVVRRSQLAALWRAVLPREHVFEHTLLRLQFENNPVALLVLRAPQAIAKTRAVRRRVREVHSLGTFANTVHAPDDTVEWISQVEALAGECARCRSVVRIATRAGRPAAATRLPSPFGRHLPAVRTEIVRLLEKSWHDSGSLVWRPRVPDRKSFGADRSWSLWLHDNDVWSGDTVIAALMRVLGLATEEAVAFALAGAHGGPLEVAVGSREALDPLAAKLERDYLQSVSVERCRAAPARPAAALA